MQTESASNYFIFIFLDKTWPDAGDGRDGSGGNFPELKNNTLYKKSKSTGLARPARKHGKYTHTHTNMINTDSDRVKIFVLG